MSASLASHLARDLVVFGGDFARYPSSLEHLVRRLANDRRVIWVETLGMRRPNISLYDAKRAVQVVGRRLFGERERRAELPANLSIIAPSVVPFSEIGPIRQWNDRRMVREVRAEIQRRGFVRPHILTCLPITSRVVTQIAGAGIVYYCPDDWASWPGLPPGFTRRCEDELLDVADLVVVTSDELKRTKARSGKAPELLPHGVDVAHFGLARGTASADGKIATAAYFGLFDPRTDQELVVALATAHPDLLIRIIGPVQVDVRRLVPFANVRFEGPVPYADLPAKLRGVDLLLLPYRLDHLAKSINPLKVREYLATGKPIVSMALAEIRTFGDCLHLAERPEDFVRLVGELRSGALRHQPELGPARVAAESWEARAAELSRMLEALATERRPSAAR